MIGHRDLDRMMPSALDEKDQDLITLKSALRRLTADVEHCLMETPGMSPMWQAFLHARVKEARQAVNEASRNALGRRIIGQPITQEAARRITG